MAPREKIMEVRMIENGTVIDHIPPAALFKIITIMGLDRDTEHRMTIGTNLESKRMGTKAIIKIADRYCAGHEIDRIALFAPEARVNTIRDFEVVEKRSVEIPRRIEGFVKCANPMCVTNHQPVETAFDVVAGVGAAAGSGVGAGSGSGAEAGYVSASVSVSGRGRQIALRCRYCEKITSGRRMELKK